MVKKEFRNCPECGAIVSYINGKLSRHERGLGYVPYRLYHRISRQTGTSVKELAKRNLCKGSGFSWENLIPPLPKGSGILR